MHARQSEKVNNLYTSNNSSSNKNSNVKKTDIKSCTMCSQKSSMLVDPFTTA